MARVIWGFPLWDSVYGLFGHFARRNSTWPCLNLALLGAVCEANGHEAIIFDGEAEQWPVEVLARKIVDAKPDIVGISAYSPFFHLSADLAGEIKKINKDIPVMGGGPHFTIVKEKAMLPQFDYGFLGEGEDSLPAFLNAFDSSCKFSGIRGLMYRENGEIKSTGPRWVVDSPMKKADLGKNYPLDRIPLPARHLLPMRKYKLGTPRGRNNFTSIQTQRGCAWKCIFCASEAIKTTRVILKSPKRVIEEMKDIATRFPFIQHLYIVDDVLLFWPEHILEICDRMDAEGLKFTFESSTRANTVTEDLIKRLSKSGLIRLSFGLETIDPVMRVTMAKKVPIADYPRSSKICADYGVEAMNSLMIGLPGETRATVMATLDWVSRQRDIKQANLAIAIPYPGTEFHEMAARGDYGVELLDFELAHYLRYGRAVTNVGDLSAQDLIDLQNEGFVMIYSKPWRWMPVWKKHGLFGFLLQMYRVLKLWKKRFLRLSPFQPVMRHPKET